MQIFLHPLAEEEYKEALHYYFEIDEKLSEKFTNFLDKTFDKILKFPNIYPYETQTTQKILVEKFPFIVIYEHYENRIMVLAIFHTKRDPIGLKGRE